MSRMSRIVAMLSHAAALLAAPVLAAPPAPPNPPTDTPTPTSPYAEALRAAIQGYAKPDTLVQLEPDRSPVDCRAPSITVAPVPSAATTDDDGHGKKLFFLYAKDVGSYRAQTGLYREYSGFGLAPKSPKLPPPTLPVTAQPVGQFIVKESWTDVALPKDAARPKLPAGLPPRAEPWTYREGAMHALDQRAALFVMLKVGPAETPDTDEGWVYATLRPDAQTVTSSGRLPKCMGCHVHAPHDRLFGPKDASR